MIQAETAGIGSPTSVVSGLRLVPSQRLIESIMITTAATMMIAVKPVFTYPCIDVSAFCASGQKISVIDFHPATSVVLPTNVNGSSVTHAYRAFPELMTI